VQLPNAWEQNERCQKAGHPSAQLVRFEMSNGALPYCMWCYACEKNVTRDIDKQKRTYLKKEAVEARLAELGRTVDSVPIIHVAARIRMCYACSNLAYCEDDHVAERTIHGELAEKLPIVPLCGICHGLKTSNLQEFMRRLRGGRAA
jgi:hypothetical protein